MKISMMKREKVSNQDIIDEVPNYDTAEITP
jgi:hypothetical protein